MLVDEAVEGNVTDWQAVPEGSQSLEASLVLCVLNSSRSGKGRLNPPLRSPIGMISHPHPHVEAAQDPGDAIAEGGATAAGKQQAHGPQPCCPLPDQRS